MANPHTTGRDRVLWVGSDGGQEVRVRALKHLYEVDQAGDLESALRWLQERRPDAVVARVEDGALAFLRDPICQDVPLLLLGHPESEDLCLAGLEAGACDYLIEPFPPQALAARLVARLRSARAARDAAMRERELLAESQMAAEALSRSEERFHAFLLNNPSASWITDEEGRVTFLSEPYTRMFGVGQDAVGKSVFEIYPQQYAQTFYDNIRAVAETGGSLSTIEAAPRPDGSEGYYLVHKFPLRDGSGRLLVGGVAADITKMKRAERTARESEARLQAALSAAELGTWRWDLRTDLYHRHANFNGILGLDPVATTHPFTDFLARVHPDDRDRVAEAVRLTLAGVRAYKGEFRILRPDGEERWLRTRGQVILDEVGAPSHMTGAVMDVTDLKRGEEALRRSEERFRLATEAISGMIYDWNLETGGVERSQGLLGLLGYWPEEIASELGWWKRQIHPDDVERVNREIWSAVENGSASFSVEYRVLHRDGQYIHAWDKGLIVRNRDGRAMRVVGSTIDLSDRQRVQEELERAHREAQAANEAKDQFLATLSHELRTPLTPVLAVISSLETDPALSGHAAELSMIRRNVELEARLIDDLLDLTRISRGKLELYRREADARRVIEHAVATTEKDLADKGLRLEVELAPDDHRVWADAPRLTQVLWNLLSNATKFTPPGGTVTLRSRVEHGRLGARDLVIEIRDTGIGIEPDVLPRIFDAFEQTDRRITRKFGGLGLGLAVSRAIVDLHGGRLTVASDGRDLGSTFTVRLPLGGIQEDLDETGAWFSRSAQASRPGPDRPLRILLVEDHPDTAEAMADLLRLIGHEVVVATSVNSALNTAAVEMNGGGERHGIDLVVSDLGLPDGSGQDLMRELVRRHHLKGIALSGYGMEDDIRRSHEAGFARHLTKPVDIEALRSAIRQVASGG